MCPETSALGLSLKTVSPYGSFIIMSIILLNYGTFLFFDQLLSIIGYAN